MENNNQKLRLILITPPFQGHMTPMLQLATILHSKGFSITVAHAHFNSPDPSNHPNFNFLPLFYGLSETHISSKNFVDITAILNTKCVTPLKELLVDQIGKAKINHEKIACIIYDGLMHATDSVARELKLPSMVFRTTSATNLLTYHAFAQLQSNGYLPLQDGTGKVNWEGVAYYNRLINYLLEKGITPYANLYLYDLPLALELKYNGLLNHKVVFLFQNFWGQSKELDNFNEPRVVAALGYDNGLHAPGRCSKEYGNCTAGNSGTELYIVAHHLILSHATAVQRYKEKYQAWEGVGVVASARKLIGATDPLQAEPGTIRGDLAVQTGRNIVHGSDSPQNGKREVDSRLLDIVPELEPLRFKDLPIFSSTNSHLMMQQLAKTLAVRPSLGVIINTVDCLEDPSLYRLRHVYKSGGLFPIGPLHVSSEDSSSNSTFVEQDYTCIAWLNEKPKNSVLYVSLGSIACWNEKELTEVACGLANSNQNFLWVIRDETVNVTKWLVTLPSDVKMAIEKRGCVVKWAPQGEVLGHPSVGGFWSHCGWNSTLESLCEGVPIMCEPYFGDQRVNARLLSHVWKVGLEWSNVVERGEIEVAVKRLMVNHEGMEMRERAMRLKNEIRMAVKCGSSSDALNGLVKSILSVNL